MSSVPSISIAGRRIASDEPPYIIAELSANHNGQLSKAFELIEAAKLAGADAIKVQTYRPDTITLNSNRPEFQIHGGLWAGRTLYELYEEAHTPWEWHGPLFNRAREIGITMFSSPFDATAIELLQSLRASAYKIASFELVDLPLIRLAARTGKPLIMSTGMASKVEISEAVAAAREVGNRDLALLHCVSGYPAPASDYNLRTIGDMALSFNVIAGLSDHTLDNSTAIASVAIGASIIEKHFTLDRSGGGPDDSFSLEPKDMSALCRDTRTAWEALGTVNYELQSSEQQNARFRRSLYFTRDLRAGDEVGPDCVRSVRPGFGLAPKFLEQVIGKKLKRDVEFATPVMWDLLR